MTIKDDTINEKINIIVDDNQANNETLKYDMYPLHANDSEIYNKTIEKNNEKLYVTFKYNYKPHDISNSELINYRFKKKTIIVTEEYYYFKLSNYFTLVRESGDDINIKINIITDNKVLTNNADKVKGNKYIWYLTNKNKENFNLEIKIARGIKGNNIKSKNEINSLTIIFTIIIVISIILLIFTLLKRKKSNMI